MHGRLARVELLRVVVADDVLQRRQFLVALHVHQVVEALVAAGVRGRFRRGQHAVPLNGHQQGVAHLVLRAAGVDVHAVYLDGARCGVEVLVLDVAGIAAIHRVGVIRAEACYIEVIRAAADFLVRRKADAHRAVFRRIGGGQPLAQRHNFRYARLIIRAVVVLDDDGVRRALHAVGCIHMRNQPDFRRMIALGGNRRVHIAVVVYAGVFDAHCVQLVHQHFCQYPLVGHGNPSLYNVDFVDDVDFCRR